MNYQLIFLMVGTGFMVVSAMVCMGHLYRYRRRDLGSVQPFLHVWLPDGGGSSPALFGVMGGLLVYACRQRKELPPQYFPIAVAGLCAAVALIFVRDGHGLGLVIGALVATVLRTRPLSHRDNVAKNGLERLPA